MIGEFLNHVAVSDFVCYFCVWLRKIEREDFRMSRDVLRVLAYGVNVAFGDREEEHIVMRVVEKVRLNESLWGFLPSGLLESLDHFEDRFLA